MIFKSRVFDVEILWVLSVVCTHGLRVLLGGGGEFGVVIRLTRETNLKEARFSRV